MTLEALFHGPNSGYVLELYERYTQDPESVDPVTREAFEYWTPHTSNGATPVAASTGTSVDITQLMAVGNLARAIRRSGHRAAQLDPLGSDPPGDPLLDPATHGLSDAVMQSLPAEAVGGLIAEQGGSALDAINRLREAYCRTTGFDFEHVQNPDERAWLQAAAETSQIVSPLSAEEKRELLGTLTNVEAYEKFIHKAFFGQKRFSVEGNDMLVAMIDDIVRHAATDKIPNVMIGMAHRGRVNTLVHILGKSYEQSIAQFAGKGLFHDSDAGWTGDVKYHLGWDREPGDLGVRVRMASNPSHLEFVNPVVAGMTRAVQERRNTGSGPELDTSQGIPIMVHGDAAFPGEGVVTETLNLSLIPGYTVGGSLHIIANNQLGYTTEPWQSRSTMYSSDIARGFEIPIIHVNADDPEASLTAIRIAYAYRQKFQKDVLIDLIGYRRWGHNEGDEPGFTQPRLYAQISKHPTVRAIWADRLDQQGVMPKAEADELDKKALADLTEIKKRIDQDDYEPPAPPKLVQANSNGRVKTTETGVDESTLRDLNTQLHTFPDSFNLNPKLKRQIQRRVDAPEQENALDWAHAEALAFATIVKDGTPIRLEGQDSERGTFSQRHLVFHDVENGNRYTPMQNLDGAEASFAVYNSPLTETATLGFDYGYSIQAPETMVLWEGQFGDFVNVGQVIIDQFIVAARAKWQEHPSLVLLLPHGYEGQGPEHSSGRLERFLQLAAEDNIRVANCTTSAQYFHLLRRHAASLKDEPRPLIVMTPKSLLRHPRAGSPLSELASGQFQPVLNDPRAGEKPDKVKRLVFCSGKVYVDLVTSDAWEGNDQVALIRVEQLYPFPADEIASILEQYSNVQEVVWLQEEPKNMAAWFYMEPRLRSLLPAGSEVRYIGRPERASPAEGYPTVHTSEQERIVTEAFQDANVPEETYGVKNAD
jgi:2-oxoglutarate dehydrogenase E1 component